jgi:hypothetical protein
MASKIKKAAKQVAKSVVKAGLGMVIDPNIAKSVGKAVSKATNSKKSAGTVTKKPRSNGLTTSAARAEKFATPKTTTKKSVGKGLTGGAGKPTAATKAMPKSGLTRGAGKPLASAAKSYNKTTASNTYATKKKQEQLRKRLG